MAPQSPSCDLRSGLSGVCSMKHGGTRSARRAHMDLGGRNNPAGKRREQHSARAEDGTATHAGEQIEQSVQRSWAQLEPLLAQPQAAIAVWNRLNWQRDQWTETDLCPGQILLDPDTQKPLPQLVLGQEAGTQLPGFGCLAQRVRFNAQGVPSIGCGSFPLPRRQCPESGRNSTAHN